MLFQLFLMVLGLPGGVQNRAPNGSEIALARVLATLGAHLALLGAVLASLGGLLALLGPLGRLLERSGTDFSSKGKPGYHGTGSALEARAASTASGEQQSRKASRKHSLQASRARSAPPLSVLSWGFAWNASRAGGRNGSLHTKKNLSKMAPKCHPGGSKNAPKSLQGGSQGAPGPPRRAQTQLVTFFVPFFRLLGGSWGAPGALLAAPGAVLAPPGPLLGAPGALLGAPFGTLWASFLKPFRKTRKP